MPDDAFEPEFFPPPPPLLLIDVVSLPVAALFLAASNSCFVSFVELSRAAVRLYEL